ncbi:hypothetical protein C8R42DRAFT_717589 [Lentinula raphanica]|nr:hypothetical protein C8R42DRAFT_717589 [Lentinula raphanica]
MNIHNTPRTIYFARSGQSLIEHSYKADSDLSPAGWEYAERLKDLGLERRAKNLASRGVEVGGKGDQGMVEEESESYCVAVKRFWSRDREEELDRI